MTLQSTTLEIVPGPGFAVQNITHLVNDFVLSTGIQDGLLVVFYKHTTGSVIVGEHETGIFADIENTLEKLAPADGKYYHHLRGVDTNGFAHVRAALMPTSLVIPIYQGSMVLGTHQEILVLDSQPEELPRYIFLQVTGE